MGDVEEGAVVAPESRSKLRATVRGEVDRNTMAGHPMVDEVGGTVSTSVGSEGNGIEPAGSMLNNSWK